MRSNRSLILLITAPSGAGKTTVSQGLLANNPDLCRVITCTSRAPRLGEKDGVDYHFLSRAIFLQRIEQGDFLEYADVYGDFKGILKDSVAELLQSGADVLLNVDVQGAATIRTVIAQDPQLVGSLVTLFITPATRGELENRLRGRDADTEESLTRRLETANSEVNCWKEYDYLVLSGSREEDLAQVQAIYFAERSRASRHSFQWTLL